MSAEEQVKQETSMKQAVNRECVVLFACLCSSKTSVDIHRVTRRYIPNDASLYKCNGLYSNIKSITVIPHAGNNINYFFAM
jgi:hypothetical protein